MACKRIFISSYTIVITHDRFRWVFCQLQVLRYCFPPSVQRILDELPDSLDETYERVLREIKKANQRIAHRLLQCLVAAVRPLRVEELAEVLAFDFTTEGIPKLNPSWRWEDQEEAVISACSSLVIVVNVGDSRIVQFSHFSVKEYLTSERLAESSQDVSQYHILLEPAHTVLAQACLGVLLRWNGRVSRNSIKSYPLAEYAAKNWDRHAQFTSVSSSVKGAMECLFDAEKPHFATWLWIYNGDTFDGSLSTIWPEEPAAGPLYHAARLGFRDLVEHLVAKHPEVLPAQGGILGTPLHISARRGHIEVVSLLIEHFPNVDILGRYDGSALHEASAMGHLEIGEMLLSHGADVNFRSDTGWTALHWAALHGELEFARMLLEHGAAIVPDNHGETPLFLASETEEGNVQIVRLLLEYGADPGLCNRRGVSPSHVASENGHQQIVQLLSEYVAKPVEEYYPDDLAVTILPCL
jgi:Ankyrin repeats (3 copies)